MKSFYFSLLLIVLATAAMFYYIKYISDTATIMDEKIQACIRDMDNPNLRMASFLDMRREWQSRKNSLALLINHGIIAPVDIMLAGMHEMLAIERLDLYAVELARAQEAFRQFESMESLSLENIL